MLRKLSIGIGLALALALPACGSGDDDSGNAGAGAAGKPANGSGGSGATGGTGASGGTGATGGSGAVGGSDATGGSGPSAGTGGQSGGDPTSIAEKLTDPVGLVIDSDSAYIACYDNEMTGGGGIFKIPLGGGDLVELADDAQPSGIAVDDDYVYYLVGDLSESASFKRVKKDGTGMETLADSLSGITTPGSDTDPPFVVYGDSIYFVGSDGTTTGVASIPKAGGDVTLVVPDDVTNLATGFANEVFGVDDSGITYLTLSLTDLDHQSVMHVKASGKDATTVTTRDTSNTYEGNRLIDGSLYWVEQDGLGSEQSSAHSLALPDGDDTTLGTMDFAGANFITADANGTYVSVDAGGNSGIYALDASGTATRVHFDDILSYTYGGSPRYLTSDSDRLYWVSGGFNHEQAALHAMAR